MAGDLLKDTLIAVCAALAKYQVDYMLVGGTAVALNGYYHPSINAKGEITEQPDIDLWYNPTYENYFNILKTLKDLGHDVTSLENEKTPNPREAFIKLEFDDFTFDLLPKIRAGIKFNEAYQRKISVDLEGVPLHVIGLEDLILDKKASGRAKDIEDIKKLEKLRGL